MFDKLKYLNIETCSDSELRSLVCQTLPLVNLFLQAIQSLLSQDPSPEGNYQKESICDKSFSHPKIAEQFFHSPDFHSVHYKDKQYSFTKSQAACIKILFECWQNKTPEVGQDYLLTEIESESPRLRDLFKNHSAWQVFVVAGQYKGNYRLNLSG